MKYGDYFKRLVVAVEHIASQSHEAGRVEMLEELLKDFVATMENPQSTDAHWQSLLRETKQALGQDVVA